MLAFRYRIVGLGEICFTDTEGLADLSQHFLVLGLLLLSHLLDNLCVLNPVALLVARAPLAHRLVDVSFLASLLNLSLTVD